VPRDPNRAEVAQPAPSEEAEVGVFLNRRYRVHVEGATCWEVVDKGGDEVAGQILVFGKVELNETCVMDGGTLNLVMDGIPAIFDVGSSKSGIEY